MRTSYHTMRELGRAHVLHHGKVVAQHVEAIAVNA